MQPTEPASGEPPPRNGQTGGTIRILCVDDNQYLQGAIRSLIERHGGRGRGTEIPKGPRLVWGGSLNSANDLLEECKRSCPDIVVLDINMPGMDAFEVLCQLVAECPECRVIVYSALVTLSLIGKAMDAGAWGVVSKYQPFSVLFTAIREVAAGRVYYNSPFPG